MTLCDRFVQLASLRVEALTLAADEMASQETFPEHHQKVYTSEAPTLAADEMASHHQRVYTAEAPTLTADEMAH